MGFNRRKLEDQRRGWTAGRLSPRYSPNRKQSPKMMDGHTHARGPGYRKNYGPAFKKFGQLGDVRSNPSRLLLGEQLAAERRRSILR